MKTIRPGVFETNSSTTHCLVLTTEEKFKAFTEGKYMFDNWNDSLVPVNDVYNMLVAGCKDDDMQPVTYEKFEKVIGMLDDWDDEKADAEDVYVKEWLDDHDFRTYEGYAGEYYETFEEHKTFGDQNIVAFGYYGHD